MSMASLNQVARFYNQEFCQKECTCPLFLQQFEQPLCLQIQWMHSASIVQSLYSNKVIKLLLLKKTLLIAFPPLLSFVFFFFWGGGRGEILLFYFLPFSSVLLFQIVKSTPSFRFHKTRVEYAQGKLLRVHCSIQIFHPKWKNELTPFLERRKKSCFNPSHFYSPTL